MNEKEYAEKMAEILEPLPEEFRSFVSYQAYTHGHSSGYASGYEEVLMLADNLMSDLLPAVEQYTQRLKEARP